jgi:hypothetical protein
MKHGKDNVQRLNKCALSFGVSLYESVAGRVANEC